MTGLSAEAQAWDAIQRAVIDHLGEQPSGALRMSVAVLEALRALPVGVKMEALGISKAHAADYLEWNPDES